MKKYTALLLALTTPLTGCGWFGIGGPGRPKIPVVATNSEGNRIIAAEKFGLQFTEPKDVRLEMDNVGSNYISMYWTPGGGRQHHLQIDTKSRYLHDDLDTMKKEFETTYTSFRVGEEQTLENGFDLYFSYWSDGDRRVGYQAEFIFDGNKVRCFATGRLTMPAMKAARDMCRSLTKLSPAAVPVQAN